MRVGTGVLGQRAGVSVSSYFPFPPRLTVVQWQRWVTRPRLRETLGGAGGGRWGSDGRRWGSPARTNSWRSACNTRRQKSGQCSRRIKRNCRNFGIIIIFFFLYIR